MCEHVPSQSKNSPKGNTTSICQTMNNAMHFNHFKQHIMYSSVTPSLSINSNHSHCLLITVAKHCCSKWPGSKFCFDQPGSVQIQIPLLILYTWALIIKIQHKYKPL